MKITFNITKDNYVEFYSNGRKITIAIKGNEATAEITSIEDKTEKEKEMQIEEVREILEEAFLPIVTKVSKSNSTTNDELIDKLANTIVKSKSIMNLIDNLGNEEIHKLIDNYHDRYSKYMNEKIVVMGLNESEAEPVSECARKIPVSVYTYCDKK